MASEFKREQKHSAKQEPDKKNKKEKKQRKNAKAGQFLFMGISSEAY